MIKRLFLSALLAAIVLMIWGFVCWGLLAWQLGIVRTVENEEAVMSAIRDQIPETGTYFFPMAGYESGTPEAIAAWNEAHTAGPVGFLSVQSRGVAPNMGKVMGMGFVHFFLSAIIAGWILTLVNLPSYAQRVKLVAALGFFAAFAIYVSSAIWWYVPWGYVLFALVTTVIGWILAGLVLARFVQPE
jgi:hypothetical protein